MLRNAKIQMFLVLVAGASIGYAAAVGKFNFFQKVEAGPPSGLSPSEKAEGESACCSEGAAKGQLLVLADPKQQSIATKAQANGKKPNILFIMGDDVGWFNIGAYHRGMMSGKTPNLDRLASQGPTPCHRHSLSRLRAMPAS